MINCAHPVHFERVLVVDEPWVAWIRAVRANASIKRHAERQALETLGAGDPEDLGQRLARRQTILPQMNILGGCCMGESPDKGVVDFTGEVFGYPNLFVADGSVVPANLGVNPSLTITALSEYILDQMPPKQE